MNRSRLILIAAFDFVLLITLIVGVSALRSQSADTPLTSANLETAYSVRIVGDRTVSLARGAAGWELVFGDNRYPARDDRIEPFLGEIESARILRDVTDDPETYADFDLIASTARIVEIETEEESLNLLFGSPGEQPDTVYVRESGDPTVRLANAAADFYLRQPASFWAYLRVFPEDVRAADLVRIRLEIDGAAARAMADPGYSDIELIRDADDNWMVTTDAQAVSVGVEAFRYARDLADLVGDGFYEGSVANLASLARVVFVVSDGREFSAGILTDGEVLVLDARGPALPGAAYGGLRYTVGSEKLPRLIPPMSRLTD